MTNDDSRTGSFWDRHNKRMQDPEHEARFNTEIARIRAVDAQVNANDDLRTALTKLADEWMLRAPLIPEAPVRALLAAHPAPGPEYVLDRRHHVHWSLTESQATPDLGARALIEAHVAEFEASIARLEASIQDPNNTTGGREYDTAKLHGQRGAVYALRRLAESLAALPAPLVVDEAEIDAVVALAAREMLTPGSTFLLPHERAMVHHVGRAVAAHMRGATDVRFGVLVEQARTDLPAATTALRNVLDLAEEADQVARQAAETNPEWADAHSTMAACIRAAITTALEDA